MQRCRRCGTFQFPAEWICHECRSDDLAWETAPPRGRVYSWERIWSPFHGAVKDACPYLVVLVELPDAGGVRLIGNLLGDRLQEVEIGAPVEAVFEDHGEYTLVQWRRL